MKKWFAACLMTLLMLCAAYSAMAAEAVDITDLCKFKLSSTKYKYTRMTDRKYTSFLKTNPVKNPSVAMTAPADQLIGGVYVCFGSLPETWEVQVSDDGKDWFTAKEGPAYLHAWVPLDEPSRYVRVIAKSDKNYVLYINEIFALGVGDKPDWVQVWEPTLEKADIMFIPTHPDDELLFFGGAIPTYAAERKLNVVTAYFSYSNGTRSSELLNGLWHMGVRNYPVIGTFPDGKAQNMKEAYKRLGGRDKVNEWFVELYRRFQPEVVVTHDIDGEYGHSQHKIVAQAAIDAVPLAADENEFPKTTVQYGAWEVRKLYLHLWKENQIKLDWTVPLASMNGATGFELADEAYTLYHKTQAYAGYSVAETGSEYDNTLFGLVHTTVGEDVAKNDFMENIDLSGKSAPVQEEVVEELPAYYDKLPELNAKGFMDEGEFIYSSEEEGLWIFIDETCKIIIERKYDPTQPLTWFETEIWTDVEAGELFQAVWNDDQKQARARGDAMETATKNKMVFAMNGDYFTYRVDVNASGRSTGVVIRDGEILHDDPYPEAKALNPNYFPNLDMLACFPDGRLEVYHSHEITAKELLEQGAYDVYSFGPYLMRDGKLSERAYTSNDSKNPRCALGMVEPGHYVYIMAEGRLKRSAGVSMSYLAKLMRAKGCYNAFNFDGGQTAVLIFMGKQINQIGAYDGGKTNSRPTCEVVGVGYSEQVGTYEVK